ncbi:NAD(P)H-dependent oxidoreductase [Xylophilus sp.]|uniref:NAD(P)H-dependent oxidoreductase n=1 Tax=Xylophilus sp. TaxID=2653893 RepID=UPI0013B831D6|nr:NAD(P)H-dependent oxidoreductase [Xylophilus sp.]KAF1048121.1 MAG: Glutathione-regulated potassium-efflux system ancillary protein KefF [Xylophilus sp.]
MHAVVVVAHPEPASFTHQVAAEIARGIAAAGTQHSVERADLAAEGFDPRFGAPDLAAFRDRLPPPADVLAAQRRLDRADALVLVYPVYWWSFPAQLKGWIDRVFTNGWAYDDTPDGRPLEKKLRRLAVHLAGIGAADAGTYERHGYATAMKTQIDHGIFDYVGARVATSDILRTTGTGFPDAALAAAREIGRRVFCGRAQAA